MENKKEYFIKFGNGDCMIGYKDVNQIIDAFNNKKNMYDVDKYILNMENLFIDEFEGDKIISRKYTTDLKYIKEIDDSVICCNNTEELFENLYKEIETFESTKVAEELKQLINKYKGFQNQEEIVL